ncbi:hypothetical protein D3C72_1226320 [compost metagenome]
MATQGVGEHGAPGLVVDLAPVLRVATVVVEGVTCLAILAVAAAIEVAQVGLERLVVGDLEDVGSTQEVLLVEVFQVRVVVLQGQVWSEFVVQATVAELVAFSGSARNGQTGTVARGTTHGMGQLTGVDGQVVDFLRGDGATLEGLRQQTAIVGDQDRQVWRERATEMRFGLREASFGVGTKTGPLGCGTLAVIREETTLVVTLTTIQVDTPQRLGINTKANGTFSEARDVVELEALAGFTLVWAFCASFCVVFTVVVVEVHGARAERQFAVFNETGSACLLGENPQCHGQGQAGLVHVLLLYVLILVYLWRWDLLPRSPWIGDLVPKRDRLVNRF